MNSQPDRTTPDRDALQGLAPEDWFILPVRTPFAVLSPRGIEFAGSAAEVEAFLRRQPPESEPAPEETDESRPFPFAEEGPEGCAKAGPWTAVQLHA